jgi:hypothetical protein
VWNDSHFVFCQKPLGEDEIGRRGVVMVKQPGLFSPMFGATSSHVFHAVTANRRSRIRNSQFGSFGIGTSCYHNCCMLVDGGTSP